MMISLHHLGEPYLYLDYDSNRGMRPAKPFPLICLFWVCIPNEQDKDKILIRAMELL